MKYNEAQQTERVSTSIGSIAFSAEILVLIALAKLAGPMLAVLWAGMIIWGVIADHRNIERLEDTPTLTDLLDSTRSHRQDRFHVRGEIEAVK